MVRRTFLVAVKVGILEGYEEATKEARKNELIESGGEPHCQWFYSKESTDMRTEIAQMYEMKGKEGRRSAIADEWVGVQKRKTKLGSWGCRKNRQAGIMPESVVRSEKGEGEKLKRWVYTSSSESNVGAQWLGRAAGEGGTRRET